MAILRSISELKQRLFAPVDIASLVFFRIAFGIIMMVEVWRYFDHEWISRYYIDPSFHFKYFGFEWVQPWPGDGMHLHFQALGVLAAMITVGAFYRFAITSFFIGFSYVFLLDQARYLNHFYLVMLINFLLIWVPAHRSLSVDAWLRPKIRADRVPAWGVVLIVAQFEIVLIYAGLVKINPDWLALQPLTLWLAEDTQLPVFGWLFAEKWALALACYGVIVLHTIGAPLLLWHKTRPYIFVLYLSFHLMNHTVFEIGIFPWMTIVGTLMFFDPAWPRRLLHKAAGAAERAFKAISGSKSGGSAALRSPHPSTLRTAAMPPPAVQTVVVAAMIAWCAGQILIPLRHYLYPGDVAWNEEGHRFAWRMKLRSKDGQADFFATHPASGRFWEIRELSYLTRKQRRKMACRPDMLLQFAHYLRDEFERHGFDGIEVRADVECSLNGRAYAPLLDPETNLAAMPRTLRHVDYILPLNEPLPPWPGPRQLAGFR